MVAQVAVAGVGEEAVVLAVVEEEVEEREEARLLVVEPVTERVEPELATGAAARKTVPSRDSSGSSTARSAR